MNVEANRLATFISWPTNFPVDVSRLARGGFYATGQGCEVQCHWCNRRINDWHYGDQVMPRHRELDPLCPFILNPTSSGNIPSVLESQQMEVLQSPPIESVDQTDEITTGSPDYTNEQCRLATFANWPISCVTPQSLAKAGFYYYNQSDHVRCAWCKGVIAKWELGDNPFNEHVKFFPSCPRAALGPNVEIASKEITNIGILPIQQSKHDQFASLDVRIRSFEHWPKSDIQAPDVLATAGFYYLNEGDHVRCFHCSGGLRSWQQEDDPWEEHAKWFPKCPFLELVKGEMYVQQVQSEMKPSLDDVMRGEIPTQALQMGFTDEEVRLVIKRKMKSSGNSYAHVKDLVMALLVMQDLKEPNDDTSKSADESKNQSVEQTSTGAVEQGAATAASRSVSELPSISTASLEDEYRQLKDARLCKVCMVEEVGIVFLPCGHLVSCVQCAPSVTSCPLCRTTIKAYVRTFLS